jgi:hypothetical protein
MNPHFSPGPVLPGQADKEMSAVSYRRNDPDKVGLIAIWPTARIHDCATESQKQQNKYL